MRRVALVGQPNVGKSLLMNRLTGVNAFVSNYPGTTVEVTRGVLPQSKHSVIDTPGTYSLRSASEDQRVTARILASGEIDLIVNVVDATNLWRNLSLTIELLDFGVPLIVALNQCDRLLARGIRVSAEVLSQKLGVPVVSVSALTRKGLPSLTALMTQHSKRTAPFPLPQYEATIRELETRPAAKPAAFPRVSAVSMLEDMQPSLVDARRSAARAIADECSFRTGKARPALLDRRPALALVCLASLLFTLVVVVESAVRFSEAMLAQFTGPLSSVIYSLITRFFEHEASHFIAISMSEGLTVPLGTVLPSMVSVYFLIAVFEDSGLLSRFAAAMNPLTSWIGLPGQGAIPIGLGLGCRSPAVLATRMLPSMRERTIAVLLLGVIVPCAATLGVVSAVLTRFGGSKTWLVASMVVAFLVVGRAASMLLPGERAPLMIEVPPLRLPSLENALAKTWFRMSGFFSHVLPMLVALNIGVRFLVSYGYLNMPQAMSRVTTALFGVRAPVIAGVLTTAFQRYLAPVVLLNLDLTAREATIASVMVCLSFPCAPCTTVAIREIGIARTIFIFLIGAILPLTAALLLNLLL